MVIWAPSHSATPRRENFRILGQRREITIPTAHMKVDHDAASPASLPLRLSSASCMNIIRIRIASR